MASTDPKIATQGQWEDLVRRIIRKQDALTAGTGIDITNNVISTTNDNTTYPIINTATSNNNINNSKFYDQYVYTVPSDGVYFVSFSQRMTNGSANYDLSTRITLNSTEINTVASGGSSYVNYITPTVTAVVRAVAGDKIHCQSKGGGTSSYSTAGGRVSIAKIL